MGVQEKKNVQKMEKYKARLVAKGYKLKYVINYCEVFALIAHMETIQLLMYGSLYEVEEFQLDVKLAFLNNFLKEKIYLE